MVDTHRGVRPLPRPPLLQHQQDPEASADPPPQPAPLHQGPQQANVPKRRERRHKFGKGEGKKGSRLEESMRMERGTEEGRQEGRQEGRKFINAVFIHL